jgi:hypothetical protein
MKFPSLNRAHKRLPDKNIPDASMVSLAFLKYRHKLTFAVLGVGAALNAKYSN